MKAALVVLFNQDFSRNIPKLETLYQGRFSHLVYLVPDHGSWLHRLYEAEALPQVFTKSLDRFWNWSRRRLGRRNPGELTRQEAVALGGRLHRVVGHQFFFYDFLTQAAGMLGRLDVDWYWVTGDDAILNPRLDETTISRLLNLQPATDVVLCRPVIGSDAWVARIAGSVAAAERRLQRALGDRLPNTVTIAPEPGAVVNRRVAVACADFFGFRKDRLADLVRLWRRCFAQKLYVEIAAPNALLAVGREPVVIDDFDWRGGLAPSQWEELAAGLRRSEQTVFAHPIKLSAVPEERLQELRGCHAPALD